MLVVRTSFDTGWEATVDGSPVQVLPVDGFLQGVPVDPGAHDVRLTYRDEAVSRGARAGMIAWAGLALTGLAALLIGRHGATRSRVRPTTRDAEAPPR